MEMNTESQEFRGCGVEAVWFKVDYDARMKKMEGGQIWEIEKDNRLVSTDWIMKLEIPDIFSYS